MSISTGVETTSEEDPAAPPGPRELPAGARPVEGVAGYHALIHGSQVTVFGPDGAEIATTRRSYGAATVGRVGDARLAGGGIGDGWLMSFAEVAARHHRAAADPGIRDRVWVRWEEDGVYAVYGTDKHDADDRRAVKAGNLYWSGQRQGHVTGRKWNPDTRDRNLGRVLVAFARQDRNVVVLGPGQEPEDLGGTPGAAAAAAAPQLPPAAAEPDSEPEVYEPEDFTGLSYEDLVTAEAAAATERSRDYTAVTSGRYTALQRERGQRLLERVASSPPVGELSDEDLAAEGQFWDTAIYKTPGHTSGDVHTAMERRRVDVADEQNGRIARALLSGPALVDLDDVALENAHEQVQKVWSKMQTSHELHEQVSDFRRAAQKERIERRARSYGERTPVGEMTLEDLVAEHSALDSALEARNERAAYSYSDAVKEARDARLRVVEAEWHRRGVEQHPDAARAELGSNIGGRRQVLIDGSEHSYGYVERRGTTFRALASYDERSRIGDFDSGPAAMAALVQRYDQDPETLPRRTWGRERQVNLPISAHDPLVSWLRRRPEGVPREFTRVLEILAPSPYSLPTQTKVMNPLTNQVMRAYPFRFEEGLLGELARIAERTTQDLRQQSLNEKLPKREREAAKRRIPAMGAALITINAVIEHVRAAGGDVERRGVDRGRLAAQMAALAGTVNEQEGGETDGDEQPVRDAAASALGGVPAAGTGADGGPGGVLPDAGDADGRGDRRGGGGAGGRPGAGDGLPGPGGAAPADRGDGAGAGAARDAAAAGDRDGAGGADQLGGGGAGLDPQGAGEPVATRRFRPDPADLPRGPLARAEANLAAVKVLRTLERENRGTTVGEARTLARWSGWGSVPVVFLDEPDPDEPVYAPGGDRDGGFDTDHAVWESYAAVRGELRELLDPFEWRAASRAVLSAHYTPQAVAEAMWQGLSAYGFEGGEVLEAGCGSGNFFGVAPHTARLTGIELDPTTAAIAGRIYPHANVLAESFTDTDAPTGTFDAVIGNVPFAQAPFGERRYRAGGHSLHNGFIIKQLALLRPGAYMAVITSRWTLDGEDSAARRDMSRWGDLAAAYRLPAGTFGETADTDVVADVLVFRRRAEGEEPGDLGWIDAPERDLGGHALSVNAYFTDHPDHVLGRLTSTTGPYGPRVTVQGDPGAAPRLLRERMEAAAAAAVAAGRGYVPHEDWPHREPLFLQTARAKHATDFTGRLYADDQGRIWQHVNGADPVRVVPADGTEGTKQVRALMALRDIAIELQELDRSGTDPRRAREVRAQLAGLHTSYSATYGPLSKPRQTRLALPTEEAAAAARDAGAVVADGERLPTGWGWFRQDPNAAVVLGLEHWDRANDRPVLSEVLTRRPGARRGDLEPTDDPKTALSAVMGATGRVDLPLIASLLRTTPEQARAALGTEVFDNPVTKKLEHAGAYLSGPVRQKLDQAREAAKTDPAYAVNVAALEVVQPPAKRLGQFTAQLGAHWLPPALVQGFLREYLGDPTLQVSHNERYGWSLAIGKVPDAVNALKGTERRSAAHIAKALLGRGSMVVRTLDDDGVDEDATRAMRYKADAMRSAFEDYCTATTARVAQLTDAYNRQMNGHVVRSYDGLAPTLEGFTTERTPHPWQLSAAARMQFERGVVLAHEVGLGKTTTMVMGSQALKASGQIGKPFAVVQPHLARQWLDEAKLLYPNADVHLITSDDLADGNRRRVLEWLRANTPDLVIFTEGAFGSIRMSPEQQELYLFREIESLKEQLKRERGVPHNNFALMQLERRLTTVESRIRRNDAPMRTPGEVYWDDLGFDYALIDEAHRFTAVGFRSKEAGGETASVRAVDLHQKLTWHHRMAEYDGGRPTVTLGTGTPMENSIFEQYSVLELATPWLLDQFGVHGPDLWSATFGQKVQRIEMAPDGSGLTIVERFSRFVSKSTMKTMWGLAADTKTGDDVGIVRPRLAGGAPELVLVEPTADQRARLQSLVARGQAIHTGDVTRDEDNMLAVSGEGRAVALDPRLVDANAPAANKLVTAADIIAAGYHAHKDRTYAVSNRTDAPLHPVPGGLFFVFANSGTPGGNNKGGFDAYAELRELLADRGVPREMVQFAQDNATPEKKAAMAEAANHGGIAVLMGSTEVLGTGFNGQNRAYALMHLDQDWTPASMIQRNGRVIRPGNQHEEVNIYFLATKGSMDAWQVGLLTSKAEGLRDIQRPPGVGDDDGDTVEEIGASDWDYATMAAEIGGNPFMRQFMEAKLHLQGLEADRRNAAADRVRQMELLGVKEGELAGTRLAIAARDKALPKITDTIRGSAFRIRIGGRDFDRFGEAGPVLRQAVTEAVRAHQTEGLGAWKKLGTFGGLDFAVQPEIVPGSGEIRAHIGFPELRHSESRVSVEDLVKTNIGATMLGRLATALEKAEDHQLMDRERLPGLVQEVAVLTAQQEAVNYGPAIEHARRRVELLDAVVGAITERDKLPELTESMLDPKKYPTPDRRRKAIQERAAQRAPHQAKVDATAAELATFDATTPAPAPVQLVNTFTEDNDTDEAFEQWREQQQIIVQQNREAGLGAPLPTDQPAPAADRAAAEPDDGDQVPAAAEPAPAELLPEGVDQEPEPAAAEPVVEEPTAAVVEPEPAAAEPDDVDQAASTPADLGPLDTMPLFEQPQSAAAEPPAEVTPPDDVDQEVTGQEAKTQQEDDQVPEGQMTVDEVQPEPVPAAPDASAPEPAEAVHPPIVFAAPPTSWDEQPEALERSEQRFGGPERLAEYADRAHLLRTSRVTTTVWLDGRLIGFVSDLEWARGSARDLSWPEEMRRPAGPRFESRPPFGHRDNVSALFVDDRAAVAELVARALQVPVPREAIDPDTAWTLEVTLGTIRVPTAYPGDDQEGADRLTALREVVANLSAGQLTSTDLADDLALAHDGLLWATSLSNTSGPYMSRAADELAELLAAVRPEDPRAWQPEPYVPPPARVEQAAPVQEQLGLFDDAEDVDQEPEPAAAEPVVEEPTAAVVEPEPAAAEPAPAELLPEDVDQEEPAAADREPEPEVPSDFVWFEDQRYLVTGVSTDGATFHTDGGQDIPVAEAILNSEMPPITSERIADGWWHLHYRDRTFTVARLPAELARGRLASLDYLIIDNATGELAARDFGLPSPPVIVWAYKHPGVVAPRMARLVALGGYDSTFPPYSPAEREFITAGPPGVAQPTLFSEEPAAAEPVVEEPTAAVVEPEPAAAEPAPAELLPEGVDQEVPAAADDAGFDPDRREDQEQYARTGRVPPGYDSVEDWLGDGADEARVMREDYLEAQIEDAEAMPQEGESMTTPVDQEPDAPPAAPPAPQAPELPPLWTDEAPPSGGRGEPQEAAQRPAPPDPGPPDLWDGFDQMLQAWAEHVPAEQGTADELRTTLAEDLQAVDRAAQADRDRWDAIVGPRAAEGAAAPTGDTAAAMSSAVAAADSHTDRLRDLPEWQQLQTVRGAVKHLLDTLQKRAGERWRAFWADSRVQGFWRTVSIRAAEAIARLATRVADKLRAGAAADRPAAEAVSEVSRAAAAYVASATGPATPAPPSDSQGGAPSASADGQQAPPPVQARTAAADPPAEDAKAERPAAPSPQPSRSDQPQVPIPPAAPEAAETAPAARKQVQPPQPYQSREDAVRASQDVTASFKSWIDTLMGRELARSNHPQVVAFREAWHRLPTADLRTGPGPAAGPYGEVAVKAQALVEAAVKSGRFTRVDVTALRALSTEASTHAGRLAVTLPGTKSGAPAAAAAAPAVATPRPQVPAPAPPAARGPRAGV